MKMPVIQHRPAALPDRSRIGGDGVCCALLLVAGVTGHALLAWLMVHVSWPG